MILAHQLTKRFEDFTALRSLSCEIEKGCIYGMVGSNGAGKSTFLRLLTGVYQPDEGSISIDGKSSEFIFGYVICIFEQRRLHTYRKQC